MCAGRWGLPIGDAARGRREDDGSEGSTLHSAIAYVGVVAEVFFDIFQLASCTGLDLLRLVECGCGRPVLSCQVATLVPKHPRTVLL